MNISTQPILIVDDEEVILKSVQRILRSNGFSAVRTCQDAREVTGLLESETFSLVLLDLVMHPMGGEEVLAELAKGWPDLPTIVITARHDTSTIVRCMKLGAVDYLVKPVEAGHLVGTVRKALEQEALKDENARLRSHFFSSELENPGAFGEIMTADPAMFRLFSYLEAIAHGTHPVLIQGETGTGKELVARALHRVSGREGPFVPVNVAGLDDVMFSDTLFGHRPGAFTGARQERQGLVEAAGKGTLFLDEIGDLPETSQVKLLRLLQEREYLPLGADKPRRLRARVIAATHRELSSLRRDLYYRLRSYSVEIPPLRSRAGDIPILARRFARAAAKDLGLESPEISVGMLRTLSNYRFPGNVRELQSLVYDSVARARRSSSGASIDGNLLGLDRSKLDGSHGGQSDLAQGLDGTGEPSRFVINRTPSEADFLEDPGALGSDLSATGVGEEGSKRILTRDELLQLERRNMTEALRRADWKVSGDSGAAKLLGMKPTTLSSRMKALSIERPPRTEGRS